MRTKLIPVIITAAVTSLLTLGIAAHYQQNIPFIVAATHKLPVNYASYTSDGGAVLRSSPPVDFQAAAEGSVSAVVHVKTSIGAKRVAASDVDDFFGGMFGNRQYYMPPQMGSGSGVVISPDGYIVTNNHVVAGAEKVTVTFNNRTTSEATVVGTDPSTDIALLKVKDKNLSYMELGNSDDVRLGQWVLAVGYPLTLDATVTAGIVSAKGRALGINSSQSRSPVESFIQTDAAVNPGNSGGALVNTAGQLIGVNSAIASPTGSYAGYSYAIPSNIVRKVANDLMEYGKVQRGYLGIEYIDRSRANDEQLKTLGLDKHDGVYVANVLGNSGAAAGGLQKGDFITAVNGTAVSSGAEMTAQVARYKPGDNLSITYSRGGRELKSTVQLKNENFTTAIAKDESTLRMLGASFRALTVTEQATIGMKGVIVTDPGTGELARETKMRKGFVIMGVNDMEINTLQDLQQAFAGGEKLQIQGMYPGHTGKYYYGFNGSDKDNEQ